MKALISSSRYANTLALKPNSNHMHVIKNTHYQFLWHNSAGTDIVYWSVLTIPMEGKGLLSVTNSKCRLFHTDSKSDSTSSCIITSSYSISSESSTSPKHPSQHYCLSLHKLYVHCSLIILAIH